MLGESEHPTHPHGPQCTPRSEDRQPRALHGGQAAFAFPLLIVGSCLSFNAYEQQWRQDAGSVQLLTAAGEKTLTQAQLAWMTPITYLKPACSPEFQTLPSHGLEIYLSGSPSDSLGSPYPNFLSVSSSLSCCFLLSPLFQLIIATTKHSHQRLQGGHWNAKFTPEADSSPEEGYRRALGSEPPVAHAALPQECPLTSAWFPVALALALACFFLRGIACDL